MKLITLANPIGHVTADDPPFFIAHGSIDPVVPLVQSKRLADALEEAGVFCEYEVIQGAGHSLPPDVDYAAIEFLKRALQNSPS